MNIEAQSAGAPMPYIDPKTVDHPFYPVGEIENLGQVISELKIAGERMEIQAGVMMDWAHRFHALSESLKAAAHSSPVENP